MHVSRLSATVAVAATGSLLAGGVALAPVASAVPSASVVINEVYGGGGNSGATLTNDFIELTNRGNAPVDVSGWTVQYASSAGTAWSGKTTLVGSINPGQVYLVQEAAGTGGTTPLPAPDATGTIAMSGTSGSVALARTTSTLTCVVASGGCGSDPNVVDLLGYGTAALREGTAAGGLGNTTSASRSGAADTDDNSADFTVGSPTPKAANGGVAPPVGCGAMPLPPECVPGAADIQDIQGAGFLSPLRNQAVSRVPGIVTATRANGFWIQEPTADPAKAPASSGLFVFSSAAVASVTAGDSVVVSGTVTEFYTGGGDVATNSNLSVTEIAGSVVVTKLSSGNPVPAPLIVTDATVPAVYAPSPAGGNVESIGTVDPAASALEFWESREGMNIQVNDVRVVGPAQPQFGEVYVTTKPAQQATPRGGTYVPGYDALPSGRLLVLPTSGTVPVADVGDVFAGATTGPVDWNGFGGYALAASSLGTLVDNNLQPTSATAQAADQLAVGTYNVENLAPADPQSKYDRLAAGVVDNLKSPDVVTLEEIQDDNGATNDAVVSSSDTLAKFVAAITAAGGPAYRSSVIDPVDDQDGGQPGGNIRVAFLYNPARVTFVAKPGGTATSAVTVSAGTDGTPELSTSPGRIDPTNTAWNASRKPLAAEFVFGGKKVIVVANHFNSKGGDQSADGRYQPPARTSETQRTAQATALNAFVDQVLAVDPRANVVLAGDFNDYEFSPSMKTLTDDGAVLTDLITTLPANQRYTYNFNGVSQVLDHIFVTKALTDVQYDVVHLNSEFSDQASDHDPQVVRIRPAAPAPATVDLLGINDFHGRIDSNTVKFAGTIEKLRAAAGEGDTLLLGSGDNIGASLFASASQQDQPTIDVLNALDMDASAVGNHEFDKGYSDLVDRVIANRTNATWDYLGANVYAKGTTTPALPEYSLEQAAGLTIGVIGAVTKDTPSLVSPGGITQIDIGDPVAAVNRVAAQLTDGDPANGEADVVVASYHEGAPEDSPPGTLEEEIAGGGAFADIVNLTSPKVAAVFTAHTHKLYAFDAPVPGVAGKTRPIIQTGSYGANIAQVQLTVDRATRTVTSYTQRNVPRTTDADAGLVSAYPRVAEVDRITKAALARAAEIGNQPVGSVSADITTAYLGTTRDDRASESTLGNAVGNALRDSLAAPERGGAQIGITNPGGLRAELLYAPDGVITYAEANSVLPFANNLSSLTLTGAQLKTVLEQQWQPAGASRPFLNLGLSDNVTYTYDPALAVGSRITSITVNGVKVVPAATFRIATFSFLATGGDNFTEFTNATDVRDSGLLDRDAWIAYLGAHPNLAPSFARRGVQVTGLPSTVQAGTPTTFSVAKLDLTSLGSPVNTTVTAKIGTNTVGTSTVTGGAATVTFTVPGTVSGPRVLTLTAAPSGTTVRIPLTVTPKAPAAGQLTATTPTVAAGKTVTVRATGWAPNIKLFLKLDGTGTATTVTTNAQGAVTAPVKVPPATTAGTHFVQAANLAGAKATATFTVTRP